MSRDINLHSFNGPDCDGQLVEMFDEIKPGIEISDTLKCSTGLRGFFGRFGVVHAGREDALDVNNRCDGIDISAHLWVLSGSRTGITLKGGSRNILVAGLVEGHGRECDVDIGNWSDQSNEKTTGVALDLRSVDGSPIRVRVLNGDRPHLIEGSGPYTFVFPSPKLPFHRFLVKAFLAALKLTK